MSVDQPTEPDEPGTSEPPVEGAEAEPTPDEAPDRSMIDRLRAVFGRDDDEAAAETEERYGREHADRLSEAMLDEVRPRRTGATAAAFFDLDKTIIARSSTLLMGRTFYRDGLISPTTVLKGMYAQAVYQLVGADHGKMEQMRRALLDLTRGWEADRVRRLVVETMDEAIAPYVYREALELFEEHRGAGRDIWIVSSSGEEVVIPFARSLGVRDVIATRAGVDDEGRYDGTLEYYGYGRNKANAVVQVAEARGYDLAACYAYTDSITDLPFLDAVGHPVAVNPDRELRAAAVAMGWDVRDFHSPVSLRQRLPDVHRPPNEALIAAVLALGGALVLWRILTRDTD
jgi:HAD superfamily hydrolase (TIGR01490 family)